MYCNYFSNLLNNRVLAEIIYFSHHFIGNLYIIILTFEKPLYNNITYKEPIFNIS